jgi:hypothetical protein
MSFATDYLAQIETIAARMSLPRVRALHLPPARAATPAANSARSNWKMAPSACRMYCSTIRWSACATAPASPT